MGEFVMHRLFPIVCNMSLTASVVILAVLAVRLLLRRAPKVFSYALWAVVLAAYCVLLPMQESKTALRMWTLGAKRRDIAGQIWTPSALMAAAGTVIALAVSIPGMSWATDKIQALTGSDLTLTVSTGQTVALCAGALAIALAVIALVSVSTAQRGIRKAG